MYADLRGDILSAAGKPAEAKAAYALALSKIDPKSPYRGFIQVKFDALGGAK
jgi:predicted negative regulator of RcsB-dependent stress response